MKERYKNATTIACVKFEAERDGVTETLKDAGHHVTDWRFLEMRDGVSCWIMYVWDVGVDAVNRTGLPIGFHIVSEGANLYEIFK